MPSTWKGSQGSGLKRLYHYGYPRLLSSIKARPELRRVHPATGVAVATDPQVNIDRHSELIFIGSCFSSNIGDALKHRKFNVHCNPQGIQFNPISIANTLQNCIDKRQWTISDLAYPTKFKDALTGHPLDVMYSFQHHSSFVATRRNADNMLRDMNEQTSLASTAMSHEKAVLFLTLGTTKIYRHIETDMIVSNCHKEPGTAFQSSFLTAVECIQVLEESILSALEKNKHLKIVFTISPVRHTRDGVVENSWSKASLLCAVNELVTKYPNSVHYFPAYEIMMVGINH